MSVSSAPSTRTHCHDSVPGTPSTSATVPVAAVSSSLTLAVPVIAGAPVAASFTGVTSILMVYSDALSSLPSFTRKAKLA